MRELFRRRRTLNWFSDENIKESDAGPLGVSTRANRIKRPFERHERFYLEDGNVIFLVRYSHMFSAPKGPSSSSKPYLKVEKTLFKIHRYFLQRDSPIFQDMFALPPPSDSDGGAEGMSDERPIQLEGTLSLDFERFLTIFYSQ